MFSANLKQFILTAHTQSLPICVPVPDYKVEVRRLDAVEDLTFPGTMSRTRITTDRLTVVLLHAMQNLVARTRVPEGVEDFLQTNAPARTAAEEGVLRTAHASIRGANRASPAAAAAAPGGIALPPKPPPQAPSQRPPSTPPPPRPVPPGVFVTVVWVVPRIASDFGVSICRFMFFWPKFRPDLLFCHMATPRTQMTSGSG